MKKHNKKDSQGKLSPNKKTSGFAGVLRLNNAAAAPLDVLRFVAANSLDDASGVACVFHLAKIEKSLSQNCKHQKIRHFDDANPFHSTFVLETTCGNVTGFTYHAVFFDDCFLIRKQLLCAAFF